jgi:hypothetical protein
MASLGLVVEGEADFAAIPVLLKRAGASPGHASIFRGQGVQCAIPTLVQEKLLPHTRVQVLKGYRKILVIIDRETRGDCPGDFAQRVQAELVCQLQAGYGYGGNPPVSVVCADRKLENWLIADPQGILGHAYIRRSIARRVGKNADSRDAVSIIRWAFGPQRHYHKTSDAPALAARVRVERNDVRKRSKSLDKLLREAGV